MRLPISGLTIAALAAMNCLAGCQHSSPSVQAPSLVQRDERPTKLNERQIADVQIAQAQALEQQGDQAGAARAYQEALKHDPKRADAYLRLAILVDQQGKFKESRELFQKALEGMPGNPEIYCDMGYSLYLQERWPEAEMNLRQAIRLAPENAKAHNNLGLVLAHLGRNDDALAEFRRAGCTEADGNINLAYVLTLDKHWSEARDRYKQALTLDASSTVARRGLKEIDFVAAKTVPEPSLIAPVSTLPSDSGPLGTPRKFDETKR
jgi:Tfp pilus assembly protein PilF